MIKALFHKASGSAQAATPGPGNTTTTTNTTTDNSGAQIASTALSVGGNIVASAISGGDSSSSLMGEGPYAFKTLWKEITKGIQAIVGGIADIGKTRNNNSATTAQLYWLTAGDRNDEQYKNTGFYIMIGLIIVAIVVVIIVNNKKHK